MALLNLPQDVHLTDVPFTGRQYRRSELPAPLEFDSVRAGELLDEAGWRDDDGDGVRERSGSKQRRQLLKMDERVATMLAFSGKGE